MENKINIAQLLKDCPKGMELDCILFNNSVRYDGLDNDDIYPIIILTENDDYLYLTEEGYLYNIPNSKCVIFPKGKTTWEGFVPPCQFKDGDIVSTMNGIWIGIVKRPVSGACETYVTIYGDSLVYNENIYCFERLATEEEKQKLFDAIKAHGYKWNPYTKTLEKFSKFMVGDRIRQKGETSTYTITDVNNAHLHQTVKGVRVDTPECSFTILDVEDLITDGYSSFKVAKLHHKDATLPSKKQWKIIYKHLDEINKLLNNKIQKVCYWTSDSGESIAHQWYVNMVSGNSYTSLRNDISRVRPIINN